ncbi:MAG: dihydroorotate dehydrogenase [Gemmatimonadetes bacterium]|nr:dihydroorotate dehydrogenase [Gemmatimonadota bacterium]
MTANLGVDLGGIALQNPVVLAAGTAGYGEELEGVMPLERLGMLTTKAVSPEPRKGAPSPRVAEFPGGMINAVGLANPGVEVVRERHLPWLARHLVRCRVLVNVVGYAVEDYAAVIARLDDVGGMQGYELNVSCPNVKAGGMEFGQDPQALSDLVRRARAATQRPLFVKLSPTLPDVARAAGVALEAGANGITVVNTWPGLVVDIEHRRPAVGFGTGGVSGPGLLPVGVLATWRVWKAHGVPIIGAGGVASAHDLLQYVIAGASAVAVGTAALRNPRVPERIVRELDAWCDRQGVKNLADLKGSLEWPS